MREGQIRSDDELQMSRRLFVAATGLALGSAAMAGMAVASQEAPRMKKKRSIRKAVKYGMVHGSMSIRDKFMLLREIGFDGVELDSPNSLERDEVLAARDATGIVIHGVVCSQHWQTPLSHADASIRRQCISAIEIALRDAKAYGATSVLVVPAVVSKETSYAEAWERSADGIRHVLPLARELDLRLAIENVWNNFLLSPLEAKRYVDMFESDHLKWYFDVGNIVNFGWPEQWVRILKHRILKLDIKEFSRSKRDAEGLWRGFDVPLLEGDCDWPAVMAALDEIGYEGWATAEIQGGNRARLEDVASRMDRILGL